MDDFLYILKLRLEGRIPDEEVLPQVQLYENYINGCVAGGDSLERVLRRLGDPSDVADKIVEAYEKRLKERKDEPMKVMRTLLKEFTGDDDDAVDARMDAMMQGEEYKAEDGFGEPEDDKPAGFDRQITGEDLSSEESVNAMIQNPEKGIKAEFSQEKGWNVHIGGFKLNSWYGYLVIVLVILVIFGLLGQLN